MSSNQNDSEDNNNSPNSPNSSNSSLNNSNNSSNNNTTNNTPNNTPTNTNNNTPNNTNNIKNFTLNETIIEPSLIITNQQGTDENGNEITNTTFNTTDRNNEVIIDQNLNEVVSSYYENAVNDALMTEITQYAREIQCSDFHGKGSIDDYSQLFVAASRIANDTRQMTLDIDIEGFNDFANAADELSNLFNGFIVKLENVSIINDTTFLQSISNALKKIVNLSNTFGRFKETILATSSIHIPKSTYDTKILLDQVNAELNCAMNYINYFVDSSAPKPANAELSLDDKNIINKAVSTIDNWRILCDQGVVIALNNNPEIEVIKSINNNLLTKTSKLRTATATLRNKFNIFINN